LIVTASANLLLSAKFAACRNADDSYEVPVEFAMTLFTVSAGAGPNLDALDDAAGVRAKGWLIASSAAEPCALCPNPSAGLFVNLAAPLVDHVPTCLNRPTTYRVRLHVCAAATVAVSTRSAVRQSAWTS
jgi:hypothetical protein